MWLCPHETLILVIAVSSGWILQEYLIGYCVVIWRAQNQTSLATVDGYCMHVEGLIPTSMHL